MTSVFSVRVDASERKMTNMAMEEISDASETFSNIGEQESDIEFSLGNPRVEHITGVVHLYRSKSLMNNDRKGISTQLPESRSERVAVLAIPPDMAVAEFLTFMGAYLETVTSVAVVRRSMAATSVPMVLLRFRSLADADAFYHDFNNKPFCSLEPDVLCRLLFIRDVSINSSHHQSTKEGRSGESTSSWWWPQAPPGTTELPTCPVCLERLDEHVSGIITTVCNHIFHSQCLQRWGDTSCPVCRYCAAPGADASRCATCSTQADLWICLVCGHVGCGRYRAGHAAEHWKSSGHCYALELETQRVWDYVGDNYVHRLIQSKTDGKLVEVPSPGPNLRHSGTVCAHSSHGHGPEGAGGREGSSGGHDMCCAHHRGYSGGDDEGLSEAMMASKLDAVAAEYNHLLASQLESQRGWYEGMVAIKVSEAEAAKQAAHDSAELARQEAKVAAEAAKEADRRRQGADKKCENLAAELKKVRQEADFLRALNQTLLSNQGAFSTQLESAKSTMSAQEAQIKDLQEQVRDLMVFIEASRTIQEDGGSELKGASLMPVAAKPSRSRQGKSRSSK